MTLVEILRGLLRGRFSQGAVLESEGFTFKFYKKGFFRITYPSGRSELRERKLTPQSRRLSDPKIS
jgi:hypothetical protein